jgi:hypothetical protein
VRRIKEVQAIARKYIERRQEQRKREEEDKRDAQRREAAKYRVTRLMRMHLNRGSEGASGDTEGMEEKQSGGEGSSGIEMDQGETQQSKAEGVRHTGVGKA